MAAGASGHTRLWVSGTVMTRNAVIGLPVIAMEDGRQLGEVVDVLVSSADGHVIGLLLDGGGPAGGFRVYPFEEVAAVGDGAVLVRNAAAVLTGRRQERLRALLQRHTTIVGRRVVGSGGDDLGCLVDIAFDVGTGRVTGYSLSRGWVADLLEGRGFVEAWAVRAFGPDAIIVDVTGAAGGGSKGD